MSNVTKGPWVAIPLGLRFIAGANRPTFDDGTWHVFPEENTARLPICSIDYGDDHHAPTRASAKDHALLIAAAPCLLGALQVLVRDVSAVTPDRSIIELAPALHQAHTALAKATGAPT